MKEKNATPQEYMILSYPYHDGQSFVLYRKLPTWEYLRYYTERKKEIYIDENGDHWIWIHESTSEDAANGELRKLTGRFYEAISVLKQPYAAHRPTSACV
jgi:hypothetical protein